MWRRMPIPACNCDAGKGCGVNKTTPDQPAYPAYFKARMRARLPSFFGLC